MCDLRRKLPLRRNHFFVWLKTAISSTACETVTSKSLLSLGPDAPHVHLRLRKRLSRCTLDCGLESVKKPRTAGLCGRAVGACDCGSLSCTKIERPSPLEKPSCKVRFFVQNRSRNYRQKVTATTLFQTASYSDFQLLLQTAHVCLHSRKRVHTRLRQQDRTQGHTRRNRGRFGWGWYHYSRSVPHVHQHPRAGYQNGKFCRFWGLVGGAPKEHRKPSEQRCAYARRCSEASRPRWAAQTDTAR